MKTPAGWPTAEMMLAGIKERWESGEAFSLYDVFVAMIAAAPDPMTHAPETIEGVSVGQRYQHHSGRIYLVIGFANQHTEYPDRHPVHVQYLGENGRAWTRPLAEFLEKFDLHNEVTE